MFKGETGKPVPPFLPVNASRYVSHVFPFPADFRNFVVFCKFLLQSAEKSVRIEIWKHKCGRPHGAGTASRPCTSEGPLSTAVKLHHELIIPNPFIFCKTLFANGSENLCVTLIIRAVLRNGKDSAPFFMFPADPPRAGTVSAFHHQDAEIPLTFITIRFFFRDESFCLLFTRLGVLVRWKKFIIKAYKKGPALRAGPFLFEGVDRKSVV